MAQLEEVVLALGEKIQKHEEHLTTLLEMIESLQRNLTTAFKEQGFDFAKLASLESSRREDTIRNQTDVFMTPEEADSEVLDGIAKRILASQENGTFQEGKPLDPRAALTAASNKGRKQ